MRLQYFRKAVGLNNTIEEEATKSVKSQQAALMIHANGTLNHFPPDTWKCFTNDGKEAAANSLLTSTKNSASIDSYMRDQCSENYPVGHRRWLLWPRLKEIGIGNTSQYNALWVLGNPKCTSRCTGICCMAASRISTCKTSLPKMVFFHRKRRFLRN
ncbi:CAP domain-containing protein [Zobellia laminariae]|uniref:CAP domain-containing protein n=1 Tax=Zobellia laminariae TaxID=248906 RepID=UPI0026F44EC7|nr:CAP domain-containing protein [Zobellia laminariae]WKX78122.1 CAP domain-containing protein [Zobellia laminariae]